MADRTTVTLNVIHSNSLCCRFSSCRFSVILKNYEPVVCAGLSQLLLNGCLVTCLWVTFSRVTVTNQVDRWVTEALWKIILLCVFHEPTNVQKRFGLTVSLATFFGMKGSTSCFGCMAKTLSLYYLIFVLFNFTFFFSDAKLLFFSLFLFFRLFFSFNFFWKHACSMKTELSWEKMLRRQQQGQQQHGQQPCLRTDLALIDILSNRCIRHLKHDGNAAHAEYWCLPESRREQVKIPPGLINLNTSNQTVVLQCGVTAPLCGNVKSKRLCGFVRRETRVLQIQVPFGPDLVSRQLELP